MANFAAFPANSKGKVSLEESSIVGVGSTPEDAVAELYSQLEFTPENVVVLNKDTYNNETVN